MQPKTHHFLFKPVDSWFFRESRSMDGAGSSALNSNFPPQNTTLLGAIRTQVGNAYHARNGSGWEEFTEEHDLASIIGYGGNYGKLKAQGAWLMRAQKSNNILYFPCPMNILVQNNDVTSDNRLSFFSIGEAVNCDLGKVRLPELNRKLAQSTLEDAYLSNAGFVQVLKGNTPDLNHIVEKKNLTHKDPRLGITRDNQTRRTVDGMLYQTNHLRLAKDWGIYLGVSGLADGYAPSETLTRLGGEARMAALSAIDSQVLPAKPTASQDADLVIYLLTPLPDFMRTGNMPMLPNDSFKQQEGKYTSWQGDILGQPIEIFSAITGKLDRMGGWDMATHQSLPVRSFIPAGSCWYVKSNNNAQAIIDALHGQFLTKGNDRALGYGQIFVGIAPTTPQENM